MTEVEFPTNEAGFLFLDFDGSESQADAIRQAMRHATNEARLTPSIREALEVLDNNLSVATFCIASGADPNAFTLMLFKEWRDLVRALGRD